MMSERNHFYTYTVDVRTIGQIDILDRHGKATGETEEALVWVEAIATHCANIYDVAGKLQKKLDDVRYKHKEIER
jgi:hypothetical protein